MTVRLRVDGSEIIVADEQASLLDVVRDQCGITSVKDGCSPQGQCGCCTVLVDGKPRVACVTPVRRVADREVTTLDGLDAPTRQRWLAAFTACGASQCGFCTPGIIVRLEGLRRDEEQRADSAVPDETVERALAAHLCRCTGWRPIIDAWDLATLLAGEGSGLGEVVKATVFLRHMRDFDIMNEVWVAAFGDHRPARTTVAVAELPLHALVEIDAWAYPRGL